MADRIRVGVAGLGVVAQTVHLPLLTRRWDLFEIAALCDLSASLRDTMGERYGVAGSHRYDGLTQMLTNERLDAVLLLTSGSHGADVVQCLQAGTAVLCEKPLSWSRREADAIVALDAGSPRVQVAYMKQYDPAVGRMRELLPPPASVRSVDVEVLHPSDASQLAFAHLQPRAPDVDREALAPLLARDEKALDVALGHAGPSVRDLYSGVVLGSVVHDLSLVRMLFGAPASIDLTRAWPPDTMPPSLEVAGTLEGGAHLSLRWHYLPDYPTYRETLTVHHECGTLRVTFPSPYLLNAPSELVVVEPTGRSERRTVFRSVEEEFENELVGLHAMVTTGSAPMSGPAQGRADIRTAQRIIRAYCEGNGLDLGGEAATS